MYIVIIITNYKNLRGILRVNRTKTILILNPISTVYKIGTIKQWNFKMKFKQLYVHLMLF